MRPLDCPDSGDIPTGDPDATLEDLATGAVHCWRFDLDRPAAVDADLARALGRDELARAARIGNPPGQRRFLRSRMLVRTILGRYLQLEPAAIALTVGPHGKPRLAGPDDFGGLVFNATHTAGQGALALALDAQVGIDLQAWRPLRDPAAFVRRCCAAAEQTYWHGLDASQRQAALFRFWTLKEAFCKAVGRGLALGLDRCVFDCSGPRPRLVAQPGEGPDPGAWDFVELVLPPGTSGAIALNRPIRTLREFTVAPRTGP